jgi:tRNA A-37 threonylcarbamoyl transferase component Bud32
MAADAAPTTECPPTADLERLVRGRLPDARKAALEDHVGACPGCQCRLVDLAGGDPAALCADLRDCAEAVASSDSAYYPALRRCAADAPAGAAGLPVLSAARAAPRAAPGNGAAAPPARPAAVELTQSAEGPGLDLLRFLQPADGPGKLGKLGPFDVLGEVGRGGMGVVLRAFDPCLTREVAIKVIDPELAKQKLARDRFCREAKAAAAVSHPNIVAVHQVDEDEASELPYLVMQLVRGESLDRRLRRVGKLTPAEVARLGMEAAAGLTAAHAEGLTHRDIKPGNILLEDPPADPGGDPGPGRFGRVKLTDFGLARAADDGKLTRTGYVAGSPLYMAPEQAQGGEADARSDLFSLGSVLYEAATGAPPFEGKTPLAVLRRVTDDTPPPLRQVDPAIPDELSDIIDRLLAKDPGRRYQTAAEVAQAFADELTRIRALSPLDAPAEVCPVASRSATVRPRKHVCWKAVALRVLPWVGGMLVGGLLVGTGHLVAPAPAPAPPAPDPSPEPRVTLAAEAGPVWALAFLGPDELVAGYEDGAVQVWGLRAQEVVRTLDPRLRGNVWAADVAVDRRDAGARRDGGNAPGWVVPPSRLLVTPSDDQEVAVWDLDSFRVYRRYPHPTSTKAAAFSPDALYLATGDRAGAVRVWNQDAQVPIELGGHAGTVHALGYSPDGRWLASAGSDGVRVWDARELDWDRWEGPARPTHALRLHKGPVYGVAFCPASTHLATAGWDGTVRVWEAATGKLVHTLKAHDGDAWSVSFGGGRLASAGSDGVKVWDVATGSEVFAYRGGRGFHVVRFGPDGHTLAAGGRAGNIRVWDLPK